ncbi:unnamed protein product [Urochloa humidicola]
MEDLGKRWKHGTNIDAGGGDWLSALPDEILHEIKARQVVQTCVLSRRWRHLWRSVSCLDIVQKEGFAADAFPAFGVMLLQNVPHHPPGRLP